MTGAIRRQVRESLPLLLLAVCAGALIVLEHLYPEDESYTRGPAHERHVSGPRRGPAPGYGIPPFVSYYGIGPPSRPELGRATWTFLHAVATNFPVENRTAEHTQAAEDLLRAVGVLFPCHECADHFRDTLRKHPVKAGSAEEFKDYMCGLHNVVNERLEKATFDCDRVDERWERSY